MIDYTPTVYIQRDPRWSRDQLGTSDKTIGQAGCLITCVASMLTDWDMPIQPDYLNHWLNLHGGYRSGNLFVWGSVEPLGAKVHRFVGCRHIPAPMGYFAEQLAAGRVVIAQVDWEPGGRIDQHWVRLLEIKEGATLILDPWQPDPTEAITTLEEHYCKREWDAARAIFQATVYRRIALG